MWRCISNAARAWIGGWVIPDVSIERGACGDVDDCGRHVSLLGLSLAPGSLVFYVITFATVFSALVLPVVGGMIFDIVSLFSVPVFYTWYWERRLAREAETAAATAAPHGT